MTVLHPISGWAVLLVSMLALWACGGSDSFPPASVGTPTPPEAIRVTGVERLVWTQPGGGAAYQFRAYLDGVAVPLDAASCGADPDDDCSSPLPRMADGIHTIYLTAMSTAGVEGAPSDALTLHKVPATGFLAGAASLPDATSGLEIRITAPDGREFGVDVVARSLAAPLQLAPIPDGRLLVSEANGRIRVVHPGEPQRDALALDSRDLLDPASVGVTGLAVHPGFADNRFVYAALIAPGSAGARMRIVRLREAGGVLGEPATIFEAPLAANGPIRGSADGAAGARLAFGPDELLYALLTPGLAFDREPAASRPVASMMTIDDAGRPAEAAAASALGASPLGLAWHPATSEPLAVMASGDGTAAIVSLERGGTDVSSTALVTGARDERAPARLRLAPDDAGALRLERAFVEALDRKRSMAVRLTVPVSLDALPVRVSGEVMDLVTSNGTIYAAVTAPAPAGGFEDHAGVVVRLRPR